MNRFLYSMRLLSLKHGSEEEYNMFEDFAICRARNGRMNGAGESRLQFDSTSVATTPGGGGGEADDDHTAAGTTQLTIDRGVQSEETCTNFGDHTKSCGQADEKDIQIIIPTMTAPPPHDIVEAHESCTAPDHSRRHFDDLVSPIHPSSSSSSVLQVTIQVKCAQTNISLKCGESSHP